MVFAERVFVSLDAAEVEVVTQVVASCERLRLGPIARAATRMGNGWLYPIASLVLVLAGLADPLRFLAAATSSLALAFAIYPVLKRFLRRRRPCDYDPALVRGPAPLDRYSCPSGHAMTAAAYSVPVIAAWPMAAPVAVALWLMVSWSRVALGHHYVSDVLLGTIIGGTAAMLMMSIL